MFCPNCKAEYRLGFTRCADCDVDLVERLDADATDSSQSPDDANLDAPILLWSGVDSSALDEIREALDAAQIPYNDEPLETRLLYASMRHPLEVWVQKSDFAAARAAVSKRFGSHGGGSVVAGLEAEQNADPVAGVLGSGLTREVTPANVDLGSQARGSEDEDAEDAELPPEDRIAEQPYDPKEGMEEPAVPRDADGNIEDEPTREVWSGSDQQLADYIAMCFREDGIRFAQLPIDSGGVRILVFSDREKRARQIVREIVEGAVPDSTEAE